MAVCHSSSSKVNTAHVCIHTQLCAQFQGGLAPGEGPHDMLPNLTVWLAAERKLFSCSHRCSLFITLKHCLTHSQVQS